MKKTYNWWTDPKNKETVERISWWEHSENKTHLHIPVSIIKSEEQWTIGCNSETEKLIGEDLASVTASGDSKEKAIRVFFILLKAGHRYEKECRLKYQRWVPFRKGEWGHIGGTWFVIFGIHVYLRKGKGMKGGIYIPFTKLNIRVYNEWLSYKKWKENEKMQKV